MSEWFYTYGGQQHGPVSGAQLKSLAATGGLGAEDLVWNQSMTDWLPAYRVKGLNFPGQSAMPSATAVSASAAPLQPVPTAPAAQNDYAPTPWEPAAAPQPAQALGYAGPSGEAVTHQTLQMLRQTRPWVMFVSVLMFIGAGFILIASLAMLALGASMAGRRGAGFGMLLMLFYAAMSLLYIVPAFYLWRYGAKIADLTRSQRSRDLELALQAQKSFWKFVGILILVVICFYLLIFVVATALGIGGAMLH